MQWRSLLDPTLGSDDGLPSNLPESASCCATSRDMLPDAIPAAILETTSSASAPNFSLDIVFYPYLLS